MAPQSRLTEYKACILFERLQEGAHTFEFRGIEDLESTVQDVKERAIQEFQGYGLSEYLLFKHVPYNALLQLMDDESSITHHCRSLYVHNSQLLRLKMPTGRAHDTAAGEFVKVLTLKFGEMHVDDEVGSQASGLMEMGGVSKEADGSWGPIGEEYVKCVLEVGASQSACQLVRDAHLWLQSEGSWVNQAITIKIAHNRSHIIIELWEANTRQLRSVRPDRPRPVFKAKEIRISLINNVPTASGCLRLSFENIFERPPRPGTNEGDFVFTPSELTTIAQQVWRRQNFIPRGMARAA